MINVNNGLNGLSWQGSQSLVTPGLWCDTHLVESFQMFWGMHIKIGVTSGTPLSKNQNYPSWIIHTCISRPRNNQSCEYRCHYEYKEMSPSPLCLAILPYPLPGFWMPACPSYWNPHTLWVIFLGILCLASETYASSVPFTPFSMWRWQERVVLSYHTFSKDNCFPIHSLLLNGGREVRNKEKQ